MSECDELKGSDRLLVSCTTELVDSAHHDLALAPVSRSSDHLQVALVCTERAWHGGEQQAYWLCQGLRDRGHICHVLARAGSIFAERMEAAGFPVVTFRGNGFNPPGLLQLSRWFYTHAIDVVHYNDAHALTSAGLACLGSGVPARVVARRVDFPLRRPSRYRLLADRVLCVSQQVAERCRQAGLPDSMLRVVHDGVDPARVAAGNRQRGRQQLQLDPAQPVLLTVASLTAPKGHADLLRAMPLVVQQIPNVLLLLAGEGPLRGDLESEIAALGLERHVRLLGYRNDVADLMHAADLFVLSSHTEGLCSTLIDCMLAERPIVSTSVGGILDLLAPTAEGDDLALLTAPQQPEALAAAVLEALADPAGCQRRIERARQRALAHFTADCMVERTLAAYHELLATNTRAAA